MKRLFAFGDSFTQYAWPMWPEILGQDFDHTENHGHPGSGNFFIFFRLVRAISEKQINKDDTVIIQWSSPSRFDYLIDGMWATRGDTSADIFRTNKDIEHLNDDSISALKQLTYMNVAAKMLTDAGCRWRFAFLTHYAKVHTDTHYEEFGINLSSWAIRREYDYLRRNLKQYEHNFISEDFATYFHFKYRTSKRRYLSCKTYNGDSFIDSHPIPLDSFSWIRDCVQFTDVDLAKLERYAQLTTETLLSVAPGDVYYEGDVAGLADKFNAIPGVKKMIKDYYV